MARMVLGIFSHPPSERPLEWYTRELHADIRTRGVGPVAADIYAEIEETDTETEDEM